MTDDIRTMRNIETMVDELQNGDQGLGEHHPGSTECLIGWRTELRKIQRILDVRGCQFAILTISELPQADVVPDDVHAVSKIKQHTERSIDAETPASVSMVVYFFCPCVPLPADHLLGIDYVSLFYRQTIRGY